MFEEQIAKIERNVQILSDKLDEAIELLKEAEPFLPMKQRIEIKEFLEGEGK